MWPRFLSRLRETFSLDSEPQGEEDVVKSIQAVSIPDFPRISKDQLVDVMLIEARKSSKHYECRPCSLQSCRDSAKQSMLFRLDPSQTSCSLFALTMARIASSISINRSSWPRSTSSTAIPRLVCALIPALYAWHTRLSRWGASGQLWNVPKVVSLRSCQRTVTLEGYFIISPGH